MGILESVKSEQNIFLAIYSLEHSLQNRELVDEEELKKFIDIYNEEKIIELCKSVRKRIDELLTENETYLKCKVYFKPKKPKESMDKTFRPIHQYSDLIDCVTAIAMLNVLIYDFHVICENCEKKCDKECNKKYFIQLSNLANLIPNNFYGNKVSSNPGRVYERWQSQYKEYAAKASELFLKYHNTREYAYEIDIDIIDFFPSINPEYIINYIMEKLPIYMSDEDKEITKKILIKLLYIEVENVNWNKKHTELWSSYFSIYNNSKSLCIQKRFFSVGLAQGLVQSYFFANIFMIVVSEAYEKEFPGEVLYYVDDSVLFTNDFDEVAFDASLKNIEKMINAGINESLKSRCKSECGQKAREFAENLSYKISIHKNDDKSTYTNVLRSKTGEVYLTNLCRAVSQVTMEINNSFSDNQDLTLRARLEKLCIEIDKEIKLVSRLIEEKKDVVLMKNYRKKLVRYKKFFKYRCMLLQFREELKFNNIFDNIIDPLLNTMKIDVEKFYEDYDDDIFLAGIIFAIKIAEKSLDRKEAAENISKINHYIKQIDIALFQFENTESSYLQKVMDNLKNNSKRGDRFVSLRNIMEKRLPEFNNVHDSVREEEINKLLSKDNLDESLKDIFTDEYNKLISYVYYSTDEIKRDILNCKFSNMMNVVLDDTYNLSKFENRIFTYKEIRILTYIRNYRFDMNKFEQKKIEFLKEGMEKIDYSLLEVIKCFRLYVKEPNRIDDLIRVHQYTCDVWKNGSKYLYFYTLHNQEHAVLLIQNAIELVKSIDFIKLSKVDFYILFISCYLHDISMVTIPKMEIFNDRNYQANRIGTEYILDEERFSNDSKAIKNLLIRYYKKLDEFYEIQVRNNHARKSGQEIRTRIDLNFIENFVREVVAEVSEAHGYEINEVYKSKSVASDMIYSKKFMQIILRLSDLLDISANRISNSILMNNIENMSSKTSFHWISHAMTDRYQIKVSYDDAEKIESLEEPDGFSSYLKPKRIVEKITIEIYVNFRQFNKENSLCCDKMKLVTQDTANCELDLICGESCDAKNCNFMCKWIAKKNMYLFNELNELKRYLNDNEKNFYLSDLDVRVICSDKMKLTSVQREILSKVINQEGE